MRIHESISDTVKPKAQRLFESFRKAPLNKSKFVHHYTSASGLRGIVESNCIWATDIAYLNDKEEIDHGITERNKVLNDIVQSSRNSPEYKDFADRIRKIKGNRGGNSFVSCFTRNGDQLSQWRGYSNSAVGYSMEFNREVLNQFFEETVKGRLIHFETFDDVIYQASQKTEIVNVVVQEYYDQLAIHNVGDKLKSMFCTYCNSLLSDYINLFKNNSFREELEVRAGFSILDFLLGENEHLEDYRVQGDIFVPYLILGAENFKLPITSITIGPNGDFKRLSKGVKLLLAKNGFTDVEVRDSKIPYRT